MKDTVPQVAMVLAAGRGARMAPLTRHRAKPALPLLGVPLLARILRQLDGLGVQTIAVNVHHAPESVARVVEAAKVEAEVRLFREPVLMGSGGALAGPRDLLATGRCFALLNGDTLCHPPLAAMARVLDERRAAGVLLVRAPAAFAYDGPWLETTSPDSYRKTLARLVLGARNRGRIDLPGGAVPVRACRQGAAYVAPGADVHPEAELRGGVVIEHEASVGAGAVLSDAVVLERAAVEPLALLEDVVVMEGVRVPAGGTRRAGVVEAGNGGAALPASRADDDR